MAINGEGLCKFCMYLNSPIWKVTLFPGEQDTHGVHFELLLSRASVSLSWENTFQMEVSTLQ